LEERYPTKADYVAAVRSAADKLVAARMMLEEDRARLIAEAESNGVRLEP